MQLKDYVGLMTRANRAISPRDEMFRYARIRLPSDETAHDYYFATGQENATALVRHLLDNGLDPREMDLLDYACGYGRVTRWLAHAFKSVSASDLEPDMIAFQASQFGAKTFLAPQDDPAQLRAHAGYYDVVFVFSLFTHLPRSAWENWLQELSNLLRPNGLLFFSTHSYELFARLNPGRFGDPSNCTEDFLFMDRNETDGRLSTAAYGITIVTDAFVRRAVDRIGCAVTHHYKMGCFDRFHDIYVARRAPEPEVHRDRDQQEGRKTE